MKKAFPLLILAVLMCCCSTIDDMRTSYSIMGSYRTNYSCIIDDGVRCSVSFDIIENFQPFALHSEADMKMEFKMSESFEFADIILYYHISVEGDWSYADSVLTVAIDTTSLTCDYVDTNAKRPVEETMVRYLRQYVNDFYISEIKNQLSTISNRSVDVLDVAENRMIVRNPETDEVRRMKRYVEK